MATRKAAVFLCGVPAEKCVGSLGKFSHAMEGKGIKCHGSSDSAFKCHGKYLIGQGYTKTSPRTFEAPGGNGPITVLTKPSRFGARLRNGKEGTRNMPSKIRGTHRGGVIVSC